MSYSRGLATDIRDFESAILDGEFGVLDAPGLVHHEFRSGLHGRKLDFGNIKPDSEPYFQWMTLAYRAILEIYEGDMPDAMVGVANGANLLTSDIASTLNTNDGIHIEGFDSRKTNLNVARVDEETRKIIRESGMDFIVVVDDVGTTGNSSMAVVRQIANQGVGRVEVFNTWQRSQRLPELEEYGILYGSLVNRPLESFEPLECAKLRDGYCAQGVPLEPYRHEQY